MPTLLPFTRSYQPPPGPVRTLPVTRNGTRSLDPFPFVAYEGPHFPVLQIDTGRGPAVWGIGGLLPATDFVDGSICPHEATLLPRLDRQREVVLRDRGALGKPVLLTLPSLGSLHRQLEGAEGEPAVYTASGQEYRLYPRCGRTTPIELDDLGPVAIADGHHRAYTHAALAYEGVAGFDLIPVVLIGGEDLSIGTFLRVIATDESPTTLLAKLSDQFHITPLLTPVPVREPGTWLYSYRGRHAHLRRKDSFADTTDPAWLYTSVLPAVFGIEDVRTDPRIVSIVPPPLLEGTYRFPPQFHTKALLLGHPISKQRFFTEVEAGCLLPPKSTYFSPRLPSGLLVWIPE